MENSENNDADTHVGPISHDVSFPDSSRPYHVILFQKKTEDISFDYQWLIQHG